MADTEQSHGVRAGAPLLAKFQHDLGYSTCQFGENHLGNQAEGLQTAHGFEEYWGYLFHLGPCLVPT